jgi:hypothetical protein
MSLGSSRTGSGTGVSGKKTLSQELCPEETIKKRNSRASPEVALD